MSYKIKPICLSLSHHFIFVLSLIFSNAIFAQSSIDIFISITGEKQGLISHQANTADSIGDLAKLIGDPAKPEHEDEIIAYAIGHTVEIPRDEASDNQQVKKYINRSLYINQLISAHHYYFMLTIRTINRSTKASTYCYF